MHWAPYLSSRIYPCFLSGSVQFFLFTLLFFVSLLIFFSLMWAVVGHFSALSLLSVLHHCLQFGLEHIWPGKSRHCSCSGEGHCPVGTEGGTAYAREWLTLRKHSPWLWFVVLARERWNFANQMTATGWSHRQWIFPQLTCIVFYCQIIVTIVANTRKE